MPKAVRHDKIHNRPCRGGMGAVHDCRQAAGGGAATRNETQGASWCPRTIPRSTNARGDPKRGGQSLMDRAQDLMQKAAEREAVSVELAKKPQPKSTCQKCSRGFVPVPNAILRSALFSVARARKRLENARIDAYGGDEIIFSGESLDQRDGPFGMPSLFSPPRLAIG